MNETLAVGKTTFYLSRMHPSITDDRGAWSASFVHKTGACVFTFLTHLEINRSCSDMHSSIVSSSIGDSTTLQTHSLMNIKSRSAPKFEASPFFFSSQANTTCLQSSIPTYQLSPTPKSQLPPDRPASPATQTITTTNVAFLHCPLPPTITHLRLILASCSDDARLRTISLSASRLRTTRSKCRRRLRRGGGGGEAGIVGTVEDGGARGSRVGVEEGNVRGGCDHSHHSGGWVCPLGLGPHPTPCLSLTQPRGAVDREVASWAGCGDSWLLQTSI
ncbi:hypothetical protein F4678DRAFT_324961 [Xylaria arbuscula]|nr:hypothetical protein F4678DRAFT_324961 [Xylaria arbuscula]